MDAESFLTEEDRGAIHEAIDEAERRTSAEFICAVATESDRYDRAESIAGLGIGLLLLSLVYAGHDNWIVTSGSWEPTGGLHLAWQVGAVAFGFVAGSVLASYWHGLRRMFVGPDHRDRAVRHAGWRIFGMHRLSSTERRAGVLIYVSLFERKVAVLADEGAKGVLGDDGIEAVKETAVEQLREERHRETFVAALEEAAERLEEDLPADDSEHDEVEDRLLQFHPRPG